MNYAAELREALAMTGFLYSWQRKIIREAARERLAQLEAVDWRAMFARYVNAWGMSEGIHNLGPGGWSFDEWKAIIELYYEVLVPEGWEPFPERWLQTTRESHPNTPEELAAISTPTPQIAVANQPPKDS